VVFHHGATRIEEYLPLFKDLPSVAGFVMDEADSLSGARAALGPRALLLGGFSGPLMESRSAERTVGLARAAMLDRREDPRFILCSSAADVPWDTPPERIEALHRAVVEAGGS
jgi:uroporphyrinogen decarboxylase